MVCGNRVCLCVLVYGHSCVCTCSKLNRLISQMLSSEKLFLCTPTTSLAHNPFLFLRGDIVQLLRQQLNTERSGLSHFGVCGRDAEEAFYPDLTVM